jgi:hypothetical protein
MCVKILFLNKINILKDLFHFSSTQRTFSLQGLREISDFHRGSTDVKILKTTGTWKINK